MNRQEQINKVQELLSSGLLSENTKNALIEDFPELAESEDERIRKDIIRFLEVEKEDRDSPFFDIAIAYLEKQKEQKGSLRVIKDASEWEKIKEQKPAEIDSIKGGDFISDGKRVFLVLANVEERNFGEIGSTFCESLILGVDGVVYCNGDDFKKYKRATSDERAKFIHNLKVGVKLKEQPAEWSEEEISIIDTLTRYIENWRLFSVDKDHRRTMWSSDSSEIEKFLDILNKIKFLRPQQRQEWSEGDEANLDYLIDFCNSYYNGNTRTLTESMARTLSTWLYRIKSGEISLPKSRLDEKDEKIIHLACEFIRHHATKGDSIGGIDCPELINRLKSLRPHPHWKPSEEQMNELLNAVSRIATPNKVILDELYRDLKKLM